MNAVRNILVVVLLVLFVGVVNVQAGTVIDDPRQLVAYGNSQCIRMDWGDNLMERVGGVDSVVNKGQGEYYIFFLKDVTGGKAFGGYVDTDNYESNNTPGYEGWLFGYIDRNTFTEGSSPDWVLSFYDPDGGQFALLDGGALTLDTNLILWESEYEAFPNSGPMEYDGVMDGFESLVFGGNETLILEHTVLVPEPATMVVLVVGGIGLLRRRRG